MKILLVDDQEDFLVLLQLLFEKEGYDVALAENGHVAFELFEDDPVELIVTDLTMPVMDGRELITKVRAINPDIPIIVTTGYDEDYLDLDPEYMINTHIWTKSADFPGLIRLVGDIRKKLIA